MAQHNHTGEDATRAINGIKSINRQITPHVSMSKIFLFINGIIFPLFKNIIIKMNNYLVKLDRDHAAPSNNHKSGMLNYFIRSIY